MDDPKLNVSIEEVKKGQVSSFAYIIHKYQKLALNIAIPIVRNQEDAEEVVQDAFVKIYRFIHQYNGESKFSSWLYKIVYNTALTKVGATTKQWTRDHELTSRLNKQAQRTEQSNDFIDEEIRSQYLEQAIDQLPASDQLLITLYYFAEKSISEISEITEWKASKCKVKLMRARHKLREILQHRKDDLI